MASTDIIFDTLRATPLFESSSDALVRKLLKDSVSLKLARRQILVLHDDPAERFFLIRTGWVKLFRETLEGSEAVIDILPVGHFFGDTAIFNDNSYPFSAEAAEPSEVISLPLAPLALEIEENPKFALKMLSSMARYRKQQDLELEHRALQNAPQRLGCFLLRLTRQDQSGPVTIHLPYDKTLVASRLGMKPETFSRALAKLRADMALKVKGSTIEIADIQTLAAYSCAACSTEFPCKDIVATKFA